MLSCGCSEGKPTPFHVESDELIARRHSTEPDYDHVFEDCTWGSLPKAPRPTHDQILQTLPSLIVTSLRNEGPMVFFKGWLPAWTRLQPTTILTFVLLEELRKMVDIWRGDAKH